MADTPLVIDADRLEKAYDTPAGRFVALRGVSLQVARGEFLAIMGPSGSGKSTFMNILGCLDKPTDGRYRLDGEAVETLSPDALARVRNRSIGFVFQSFNLLQRMTLADNVALPLVYAGQPRAEGRRTAREMLARVGLGGHSDSLPNRISGGQQQRAAIARALINRPHLLLADEPTGNLDSQTSREIMDLFTELNRQGITIVLVTHEHDVAAYAQRQVTFLDGCIVSDEPVPRHSEAARC